MLKDLEQIFGSDLPEIEKLARAFQRITDSVVESAENEIEVVRALGDRDSLVKEQIRSSTMRHAQMIFRDCYRQATGRRCRDD
jgi:hypothetical protein